MDTWSSCLLMELRMIWLHVPAAVRKRVPSLFSRDVNVRTDA